MHAHDPRPENGNALLTFAKEILPSATSRPLGTLRVDYDKGEWRVSDDRGHVWRVIPDPVLPDQVMFEVEAK